MSNHRGKENGNMPGQEGHIDRRRRQYNNATQTPRTVILCQAPKKKNCPRNVASSQISPSLHRVLADLIQDRGHLHVLNSTNLDRPSVKHHVESFHSPSSLDMVDPHVPLRDDHVSKPFSRGSCNTSIDTSTFTETLPEPGDAREGSKPGRHRSPEVEVEKGRPQARVLKLEPAVNTKVKIKKQKQVKTMGDKNGLNFLTILLRTIFMIICVGFIIIGVLLMIFGSILAFVPGKVLNDVVNKVKSSNKMTQNYTLPHTAEEIQAMPMVYEIGLTLFTFGALLSGLSLFGTFGVCCPCCAAHLVIFALAMLCLMIGETVVISMFMETTSLLHDGLRASLKEKIKSHYAEKGTDPFSKIMNLIMSYFKCCGVEDVGDFGSKPEVCARKNTMGCYTRLTNMVQDHYETVYLKEIVASIIMLQLTQITTAAILF